MIRLKKYASEKEKKLVVSSHVISRLLYNAPVIAVELEETKPRVYNYIFIYGAAEVIRDLIRSIMANVGVKQPPSMVT